MMAGRWEWNGPSRPTRPETALRHRIRKRGSLSSTSPNTRGRPASASAQYDLAAHGRCDTPGGPRQGYWVVASLGSATMDSVRDPPSIPPQLELRPAKAIDRREILDLWDRRAGFEISKTVDAVVDDETAAYGFVTTNVETVVGFGVVLLLTAEGARDAFPVSLDDRLVGEEVAVFHASAVEEGWEGRGIGSALMWAR